MIDLIQRLATLPPAKQRLLLQTLQKQGSQFNVAPLSFAQQRLWFLFNLDRDSPAYNIPIAFRLSGSLDIQALEQSLNTIIRRHATLRTGFITLDGQPIQVVLPELKLTLQPITDLTDLDAAVREAQLHELLVHDAHQPFDLTRDAPIRAKLFRLEPAEHIFLLTIHHIASDAWSTGIFQRELGVLYQAFSTREPATLWPLPIQYTDFAQWQHQWLLSAEMEAQLEYWKRQLAGAPQMIELPTDYRRPSMQTFRGAHQSLGYSPALAAGLRALSQQAGTTLFMTLLAGFAVLLNRYTRQTDLVVGSPIANRNRSEIEDVIGCFVNTLVLRLRLDGNPTFRALLGRVSDVALDAFAHQDLPFEKLVDELHPVRDLSRNPVFQVLFDVQNIPKAGLSLAGLTISRLKIDYKISALDLTLSLQDTPTGLLGVIEYNTDLFAPTTIDRLIRHYEMILTGIVADPDQPISQIPILTADEQHTILVKWNATATQYPATSCIHELFQNQASKHPEAEAVAFEGEALSYVQLDQRANQLAHYLQQLGVGPEMRVGICVTRSLDLTVGLLGILKAGGCYVALDPSYPLDRLSYMIADAHVTVLLTQQHLASALQADGRVQVLLDDEQTVFAGQPVSRPISSVTAENTAYVIYTSGSTGRPKGVPISHRSVVNLAHGVGAYYGLSAQDRVLQAASISFDVAVEELFPSWSRGATVVLRHEHALASPEEFLLFIERQRLTVLNIPTPFWHEWVSGLVRMSASLPASLRLVIVWGEQPMSEQLAAWQRIAPTGVRWCNAYGPTEATVTATLYEYDLHLPVSLEMIVPIGQPIANTQTYVLDPLLRPVPVGVSGELYIGGDGLSRGYLDRPALTAETFIPDPFSLYPGKRLYKTGDLVRLRVDGNLEFLGRIDHQVKIRGYRIELEEIEAVLSQYQAVESVVVMARDTRPGDKRLVAYLVPKPDQSLDLGQVRSFLQEQFPAYMIPSVFMVLAALPLTPSGKVDRAGLPQPSYTRLDRETTYVAPRTPLETQIARVWADVLHLEHVGVHDNFFELGGDSLLSMNIIARARQEQIDITPRHLFQHQTVAELAAALGVTEVRTIEQGLVTGAVPLTPIQRWFFARNLRQPDYFNQDLLFEVCQPLDKQIFVEVIQHLLLYHDMLRARFIQTEAGWNQIIIANETHPIYAEIDLTMVPPEEQAAAIRSQATELQARLNLTHGPLVCVALFDLGPSQAPRLLIAIHHLVVDWVSWHMLLEDLETAYAQRLRNEPIMLPSKTTSFKVWAERLEEYAQSVELLAELSYWLPLAEQTLPTLPCDIQGGPGLVASERSIWVTLDADETDRLLHDVPGIYRTQINDVLLTALAQAMRAWTGSPRIYLDLENHGRQDLFDGFDTSRTLGWFTVEFPVVLDLGWSNNPVDELQSIKEQLRGIPHHGFGYSVLRYMSAHASTAPLRALPPAPINFNYLGRFDTMVARNSILQPARESSGLPQSPQEQRSHVLAITALIRDKQLRVRWSYSEHAHHDTTIERVATMFIEALRTLLASSETQRLSDGPRSGALLK